MSDDLAKILFLSSLREAIVNEAGMSRDVHSLTFVMSLSALLALRAHIIQKYGNFRFKKNL